MAVDRTGAGDPARTLELLWRTRERPAGRRGPRRGLSIDAIVGEAIERADAEGLAAVTMRRIAARLEVAPMTLYGYVPSKAELLDLMLDTVYAGMPRSRGARDGLRPALETIAHDNHALYEAHPWAATISTGRPPLGPGLLAKYEHELSALEATGLDDVEMDAALTFLLDFVQSSARAALEVAAARSESESDDEQWWAANAPLLARVLDEQAYPLAARVGSAAGSAQGTAFDPARAYSFGLERVLDALEMLVEDRGRRKRPRLGRAGRRSRD